MLPEQRIAHYIREATRAIEVLQQKLGIEISALEFQIALAGTQGLGELKSHHVA